MQSRGRELLHMRERIFVLIVMFGSLMLYDGFHLKTNGNKKEKAIYLIIMLASLYMGIDYVVNRNWVDYYDLIGPVFAETARQIENFLTVHK